MQASLSQTLSEPLEQHTQTQEKIPISPLAARGISILSPEGKEIIQSVMRKIYTLDINLNEDELTKEMITYQLENNMKGAISTTRAEAYRIAYAKATFEATRELPNGGLKLVVTNNSPQTETDTLFIPKPGSSMNTDEAELRKAVNMG